MAEKSGKKLTPEQAIYQQAQQARKAAEKLEPLLDLLKTPEDGDTSPIEQLQEILEAMLHGQRLMAQRIEDLHDKIDAQSTRRG